VGENAQGVNLVLRKLGSRGQKVGGFFGGDFFFSLHNLCGRRAQREEKPGSFQGRKACRITLLGRKRVVGSCRCRRNHGREKSTWEVMNQEFFVKDTVRRDRAYDGLQADRSGSERYEKRPLGEREGTSLRCAEGVDQDRSSRTTARLLLEESGRGGCRGHEAVGRNRWYGRRQGPRGFRQGHSKRACSSKGGEAKRGVRVSARNG